MKSRTSFSKLTPFKKNLLRFAPLWAIYLIGIMLVMFEVGGYTYYDAFARNRLAGLIHGFGIVNLIYASISAVMLFGDLYNTRMCYSLHALPQKREHWLVSHLASGMLFSLVPNLLATLYLMTQLQNYWFLALYWLLAVTLQFIFFFGVATVSTMLTGNRFAALLVCAGFNFAAMLAYATVQIIYIPMFTGVYANLECFARFSPVVHLFDYDYFLFTGTTVQVEAQKPYLNYMDTRTYYEYNGLGSGWGYLVILGVVGLAAMGVALWLYRKRHLESAGDFLAFPKLKAPACVLITLCVALCAALVGEVIGTGYIIWLFVGLTVGFFGGLMLLERRVKVFRKKTFLGFGILAVCMVLSLCAIHFDWFGIERWTPQADSVQSVTVSNYRNSGGYYDNGGNRLKVTLTDEADIAQIVTAHKDILNRLDEPYQSAHRVTVIYKMKSGRTVTRSYSAPASGLNYEIVMRYLYTKDSVLGFTDWTQAAGGVEYMYSSKSEIPSAFYGAVLEALQKDYEAGHVVYGDKGNDYLDYRIRLSDGTYFSRTVSFSGTAENLWTLMKSSAFQMGYTDWDTFLETVSTVNYDGMTIRGEDRIALLEAIRMDVENGNLKVLEYNGDALFTVEYRLQNKNGQVLYREFYIDKYAEHTLQWYQAYTGSLDK